MGHADSVDAIVRYASGRRLLAQTVQYFHTDELRLIVSHYMLVRCRIFVYGGLRSREAPGQLNTATIGMLSSTPLDFSPGSVEAGTAIAAWEDAAALPNVLKSRHMPLLGACWLRVRIRVTVVQSCRPLQLSFTSSRGAWFVMQHIGQA